MMSTKELTMKTQLLTALSFLLWASPSLADDDRFAPTRKLPTREDAFVKAAHAATGGNVPTTTKIEQPDTHIPLPKENPFRRRAKQ